MRRVWLKLECSRNLTFEFSEIINSKLLCYIRQTIVTLKWKLMENNFHSYSITF